MAIQGGEWGDVCGVIWVRMASQSDDGLLIMRDLISPCLGSLRPFRAVRFVITNAATNCDRPSRKFLNSPKRDFKIPHFVFQHWYIWIKLLSRSHICSLYAEFENF